MRNFRFLTYFLALNLFFLLSVASAQTTCSQFANTTAGQWKFPSDLKEVSGIVLSRSQPGVIWAHNDSGNAPKVYAFLLGASSLTPLGVVDLSALKKFDSDWEDISIGKGPDGSDWIYISDTGNNDFNRVGSSKRPSRLLRFKEPFFNLTSPAKKSSKKKNKGKKNKDKKKGKKPKTPKTPSGENLDPQMQVFDLNFPGQYDVEAMSVHPNGFIYLISKELNGQANASVFRIASNDANWRALGNTGLTSPVALIATLNIPSSEVVTAADFRADGIGLAVLTKSALRLYQIAATQNRESIFTAAPLVASISETQAEGTAFASPCTILISSEVSRILKLLSLN